MSVKVYFLHSHFSENLGALSEEQGERFHQDIETMEERYQGQWNTSMMVDYCWCVMRDCSSESYSRQTKRRKMAT